jgi:hypothetical protein
MTSIEILYVLLYFTSDKAGMHLIRQLQTSEGFVLEKVQPIVERVVAQGRFARPRASMTKSR